MSSNVKWAAVTPSYNRDFERCRLLCLSMDSFLSGPWHHYIIVDPVDVAQFEVLMGPRRSIIDKREILPDHLTFVGKIPFMRLGRMWWSWRHGPVLGWQMQQLVKISMASQIDMDAMIFLDSDVCFLKPFNISQFERHGKIRFFNSLEHGPKSHAARLANARPKQSTDARNNQAILNSMKFLGLPQDNVKTIKEFDQLVTWHRNTAVRMTRHLEQLHQKPWQEIFGSTLMFSEYGMYSAFVTDVQKTNPDLYEDPAIFCKSLWNKSDIEIFDLAEFCNTLAPIQVAICIQSLIGVDIKAIENEFRRSLKKCQ